MATSTDKPRDRAGPLSEVADKAGLATRPIEGRAADRGRHGAAVMAPAHRPGAGLGLTALCTATGVFVAAASYAAGRLGHAGSPWADRAYWLGQALILVPTAVQLLGRKITRNGEILTLVVIVTVAEYLIKICYSPLGFTFADELIHWRSTISLMQSGMLYAPNYMLPIGARYPGLEEATSAMASATTLPVFTAGLIIAGAAHLLFITLLYLTYRHIGRSPRIAGVAILLYLGNPDAMFFDSMFVYQTLALGFMGLALLAAWRAGGRQPPGQRLAWLIVALVAIAATVATHHLTALALVLLLLLAAAASLITGDRQRALVLSAVSVMAAGALAGWVAYEAPGTIGYLAPPVEGIRQGLRSLFASHHVSLPAAVGGPAGNQLLVASSVLIMSLLLPVGWWQARRSWKRRPWLLAMAVGSLSWYAIVAVRLIVADGNELAGRAATFVYIPAAFIAAVATIWLARAGRSYRRPWVMTGTALMGVLTLLFAGLASGWPPYWERLPGAYHVAGFESSVGPEAIDTARWALSALGPGNRFAVDAGNSPIIGSYGDQDPVRNVAYLYTSATYTPKIAKHALMQGIRYILVDRRLSGSLPAAGHYFVVDPEAGHYRHPIPLQDLVKFSHARDLVCIYDSGYLAVYEVKG
jgi:hypothetical protein